MNQSTSPTPANKFKPKRKKDKFCPEHFPAGTVFRIDDNAVVRTGADTDTFTCVDIARVGVRSYVLHTDTLGALIKAAGPGQDEERMPNRAFNISHVCAIVKRGNGPVMINERYDTAAALKELQSMACDMQTLKHRNPNCYYGNVRSSRSNYVTWSISSLVRFLIMRHNLSYNVSVDAEALQEALMKQTFARLPAEPMDYAGWCLSKKRTNKWFKANINRFLVKLDVEEKREEEENRRAYMMDMDADERHWLAADALPLEDSDEPAYDGPSYG